MERSKPTAEDAKLVLELMKLFSEERQAKAMEWYGTEFEPKKITDYVEFVRLYPRGSEGSMNVGRIMGVFELAGGFIENGVLNEDLFFDICPPPKFFWESLKPIIYGLRGEMKEPRIGENFELLYERHKNWAKNHPPKIKQLTVAV
jgi:hypothetical protein